MSNIEFQFLKDRPLETASELSASKFGHDEISRTLSKIVARCPAPFTIGLFAKWGAGKSTVANALREELPKLDIPVVIFDVWKHEGDALRRTFLKETVRQLDEYGSKFFDKGFKLNDRLEKSVTHSSVARFKFEAGKLRQLLIYGVIGVAILGLLGWIASVTGTFDIFKQLFISITGFSTGGVFVIWLVKESVQLFSNETTSYGVDRFEDPHEFELEFHSILRGLKRPRILIVFDNLDRVTHDKVAQILSTIKTFLEPRELDNGKREVVFLVPCDARAIKQHLKSIYDSSGSGAFDPDEFLRKFFNSILWIPDFIPAELESFARMSLKDTKVTLFDNDYVAWIITKAFRNNPRQIIQFVNILLANYLLVLEREGEGRDFPEHFLEHNMPQLAKYLVLNQLFPDEMEILRDRKVLNLQDVSKDSTPQSDSKFSQVFVDFVRETPSIPITNLRIFFTLRRSEQEKKFPGFDSFIALLEDQKSDDSKKYFLQLGDFTNGELVDNFSQAMKSEIDAKTNPVSLVNLIYTLLGILDETKVLLTDTIYAEINNALRGKCNAQLHVVPADLIARTLLERNATYRVDFAGLWIKIISSYIGDPQKIARDRVDKIVAVLSEHPDYLTDAQSTEFRNLLENSTSTDLAFGKLLVKNIAAQRSFLSTNYVSKFIAGIQEGAKIDEIIDRLEVVNAVDASFLVNSLPSALTEKMTKIQLSENQRNPNNDREKLSIEYTNLLRSRSAVFTQVPPNVMDAFIVSEIHCFNTIGQTDGRTIFIPLFVELRKFATPQRRGEVDNNIIGSFLSGVSPAALVSTLAKLSDTDKRDFFEQSYYSFAENRALNDTTFRAAIYPYLIEARKRTFLQRLFTHNYDFGLQFAEGLGESDQATLVSVYDSLWTGFDARPVSTKKRILDFINKCSGWNNSQIQENAAAKMTALLTTLDASQQQCGFSVFGDAKQRWLTPQRSRRIAKEVFDWLLRSDVAEKNQPFSVRAVLLEDSQFTSEEKGQFRQFIFDELVRKGATVERINLGFEAIRELKPSYEERKLNYDDIFNRIAGETNPGLKNALIIGLKALRPSAPEEAERDFWVKVESLT